MRIISGSKRGRKLISFEGESIRPTTDRVKESMFNLICDYVYDSSVLDLFGGSGALALEALSRGAANAVLVDVDKRSLDVIKKNIELTGFSENAKTVEMRAELFLERTKEKFDMIFLDPPYNRGFIAPIVNAIVQRNVLKEDGIVILESDFGDEHGEFDGLEMLKQRKYGRTYITVYKKGKDVDRY